MAIRTIIILSILYALSIQALHAQGWVAEVTITIKDADLLVPGVDEATSTFSAIQHMGTNAANPYTFSITGNTPLGNSLSVNVKGKPLQNKVPIEGLVIVNVLGNCQTYQTIQDQQGPGQITVSIKVYPRTTITVQQEFNCATGNIIFQASSCVGAISWVVSQGVPEVSKTIQSVTSSVLVLNSSLLKTVGFADPYGNFNVTASHFPGTTSSSVTKWFSAKQSQVTHSIENPKCNGESGIALGGKINLTITPAQPQINNFIVSLFTQEVGGIAVANPNVASTQHTFFVGAGSYWVAVKNDQVYGCETPRIAVETLIDPPKLSVSLLGSNFNGKHISCAGAADGSVEAIVSNANLPIKTYSWEGSGTPNGSKITGCGPGNHSVTVTDNMNCTASSAEPINLIEPPPLTLSIETTDATCAGKNDGEIIATPGGGVGSSPNDYTYFWSAGAGAGLLPGEYSLTVKDANAQYNQSCGITIQNIVVGEPLAISFDIDEISDIDCPEASTGSLSVGPISYNQGAVTYLWSTTESNSSIQNKPAGNYWLRVTDALGCHTTVEKNLDDPDPFSVQISPTAQVLQDHNGSIISCHGESDGELQAVLYNPQNVPVIAQNYQWSRNNVPGYASGQTINGLNAATYKVVATNDKGCEVEVDYNLQQPSLVTVNISSISNYNSFPISCPGESDGSITAVASGGTPGGYTYQWQDGPITQNFMDIDAGDYFVTAHDINGCEGTSSYQLNDPPAVVPSIAVTSDYNGQAISCAGESDAILTASAGGGASPYTFTWSHGSSGNIANNLLAGSYSVQAMDANGCQEQSSPTDIIDPDPVEAQITILSDYNGQAIQCNNSADGRLEASGAGGTNLYSYVWSTNEVTAIINDLPHGIYSVVVTDQNGCNDFEEVELLNPTPVIASIDSHSDFNGFGVQCHGSQNGHIQVSATGGTNNFTFDWPSLSQTTSLVEDLGAGEYMVIVTDSNSCSDDVSFEITEPTDITLVEQSHTDIACYGGSDGILSVVSGGGFGTHEYSINNSGWQLFPDFSGLIAEIPYIVTAKDGNQCLKTFETQLDQPNEIEIEFQVEPALCADPVGEASAEVSGGIGSFIYEWKDAMGNVIGTYASITKQFAGIYTLLVYDEHQCPMEKPIGIVSVDGPVGQVVENAQTSCFDSADGYARIDVINGEGPFTIAWDGGANTYEVSDLARGEHFVSITDVNNCLGIIPVTTLSPEEVSVSLVSKNDVSCYLSCDGSIEVNGNGGNGDYTFKWNDVNGTQLSSNLCAGVYKAEVKDKLGCQSSQFFTVTQPDRVEVRIVNRELPKCNGGCNGAIEVVASGGKGNFSYLWSAGSQSEIQNNVCSGSYTVTAKDLMNCAVSRTFDLGEPTKVEIAMIENQVPTCHDGCDGTIEVIGRGGAGNYRFAWDDGSSLSKNESLCVGEHNISIIDANNCQGTAKYSISNVPELKIDLGGGLVVCEGQEHELDAGSSWRKIEWTTSGKWISSSSKITISQAGAYNVQVFDANNCTATDSFVLETSDDLLQANFIITAEAMVGDTTVMVDISWPLPDNATWRFPTEMIKILDNNDVIHGKFEDAGDYDIILNATLGQCKDEITKTITILEDRNNPSGGRLGAEEFLKTLTLHPNPNTGTFEVEVEFISESPITITIWNLVNTLLMTKVNDNGSHQYKKHFDLHPITSGTYLLRLDFEGGHRTIRFLVH